MCIKFACCTVAIIATKACYTVAYYGSYYTACAYLTNNIVLRIGEIYIACRIDSYRGRKVKLCRCTLQAIARIARCAIACYGANYTCSINFTYALVGFIGYKGVSFISTATPSGSANCAAVACAPSPEK